MLSCYEEPPRQQVAPEVVRTIVCEVLREMQIQGRSPHDSPQMRPVSTASIRQTVMQWKCA